MPANVKPSFFSFGVMMALMGGLVGGIVGAGFAPYLRTSLISIGASDISDASQIFKAPAPVPDKNGAVVLDEQTVDVVNRTQAAVVSIVVSKDLSKLTKPEIIDPFTGEPFWPLQNFPKGMQKIGGGSGFLVSADGLIVTNKHVIEDEDAEYTVVLRDGGKLPAKVLARDPVLDLAILDVEGENYPYLTFADSDALQAGQTVIAIGNALDEFRNTVTKGIVSGLNRRLAAQSNQAVEIIEEAIQTDAAINPGNSGGPLIDLQGRVVGVNTAVSFDGQSLGFALPSNLAKRDVTQIQKFGRITRSFLGVRYLIINEELIKKNQLTVNHGVLVQRGSNPSDLAVIPGSPADKAGIKENDIILSLNNIAIDDEHSLSSFIGRNMPEDKVKLKIYRQGQEIEVEATLDEFKPPKD